MIVKIHDTSVGISGASTEYKDVDPEKMAHIDLTEGEVDFYESREDYVRRVAEDARNARNAKFILGFVGGLFLTAVIIAILEKIYGK